MTEYKDTCDLIGIQITTSKLNGKNILLWQKYVSLPWCKRQIEDIYSHEIYLYQNGV